MGQAEVMQKTGAEEIVWNLGDLYKRLDDPAIDRDMKASMDRADKLSEARLNDALTRVLRVR